MQFAKFFKRQHDCFQKIKNKLVKNVVRDRKYMLKNYINKRKNAYRDFYIKVDVLDLAYTFHNSLY